MMMLMLMILLFIAAVSLVTVAVMDWYQEKTAQRRQVVTRRVEVEVELDDLRSGTLLVSVELDSEFQRAQQLLAQVSQQKRNPSQQPPV